MNRYKEALVILKKLEEERNKKVIGISNSPVADVFQELVDKYTELNNVYHKHEPMETADLNAKRLEEYYKEVEPFINKATPKKVKNLKIEFFDDINDYGYYSLIKVMSGNCPNCNYSVVNQNYCEECGQKLDWSE